MWEVCIGCIWLGEEALAVPCEYGNEHSDFIKSGEFIV
jgi:hypothetical protein